MKRLKLPHFNRRLPIAERLQEVGRDHCPGGLQAEKPLLGCTAKPKDFLRAIQPGLGGRLMHMARQAQGQPYVHIGQPRMVHSPLPQRISATRSGVISSPGFAGRPPLNRGNGSFLATTFLRSRGPSISLRHASATRSLSPRRVSHSGPCGTRCYFNTSAFSPLNCLKTLSVVTSR